MAKKTTKKKHARKAATRAASKKTTTRKKAAKKASGRVGTKKTTSKSTARGAAKKSQRKTSRKPSATAGVSPGEGEMGPRPVLTGAGPTPAQIGAELVAMVRAGRPEAEVWDAWFHPDFVSIEGTGQSWHGRAAVAEKCRVFYEQNIVHGVQIDGPLVGATGFAVRYTVDTQCRTTGIRVQMSEVGVYTVRDGRIVQEEFMYAG